MPVKHEYNDWECKFCGKHHPLELKALGCEQSHEVILVPIYPEDLKRLIQFLYLKDEKLLPERLVKTLMKYNRIKKAIEE